MIGAKICLSLANHIPNFMIQPSSHSNEMPCVEAVGLAQRLHQHPHIRAKVEELLAVVENVEGDLTSADAAEQRVIEEIQKLGQAALQGSRERHASATNPGIKGEDPRVTSVT